MQRALENASNADLCLVLGSSLSVTPANEVPAVVGQSRSAKLVICNLQKTPLDNFASTRIWCKIDDLMTRVMQHLGLPIPAFVLQRRLRLQLQLKAKGGCQLLVAGLDVDGTPATFLQSVQIERRILRSEPYIFELRNGLDPGAELKLILQFMGHYNEPNLELMHRYGSDDDLECTYLLGFDPQTGKWSTQREAFSVS